MKISVIIPSYKPQPYLRDCLYSLEKQTFDKNDFEVIIVLNGCCEPYLSDIRKNLAGLQLMACVVQTDIPGVSNARNIGLDLAQGDFITFIDDDDLVSETYLAAMYDIAVKGHVPLSNIVAFKGDDISSREPYYISNVFHAHKDEGVIKDIVRIRSYFSTSCCKLLERRIIGSRRFDVRFTHGEDSLFMFLISDRCHSFQLTTPDVVYYRRLREGSAVALSTTWSFKHRWMHAWACIAQYTRVYCHACKLYNLRFYLTRVGAALKMII